jgi:peptide/nickel transport system permease protein
VLVMLSVAFIAFSLFQFVGDPISQSCWGRTPRRSNANSCAATWAWTGASWSSSAAFVGNAVQGEFGLSLRQGRKVSTLIAEAFPATIELALAAAVIAVGVGIPLGVYAALRRGRFGAQLMMALSLVGVSLPTFLIGILLIMVFAVNLQWLPSNGRGETVVDRLLDHRPA